MRDLYAYILNRTTSKESRLLEYLTTENLPALTPAEVKLLTDAAGDAKFRSFVCFSYFDLRPVQTMIFIYIDMGSSYG